MKLEVSPLGAVPNPGRKGRQRKEAEGGHAGQFNGMNLGWHLFKIPQELWGAPPYFTHIPE